MNSGKPAETEDALELLNDSDKEAIQRWFSDLSKASVAKQLAVGGATGWYEL